MSIFWGMYHETGAATAASAAGRAESVARSVQDKVRTIEDRVDSLALLCQAMWELLRDNTALSEDDIERKSIEIDMRDGVRNQRLGHATSTCASCNRPLHRRHARCLYCGAEVSDAPRFGV